jgi:hypothetical protein
VVGVHLNALLTFPSGDPAELTDATEAEQARLRGLETFEMGYLQIQGTRPQTLRIPLVEQRLWQEAEQNVVRGFMDVRQGVEVGGRPRNQKLLDDQKKLEERIE